MLAYMVRSFFVLRPAFMRSCNKQNKILLTPQMLAYMVRSFPEAAGGEAAVGQYTGLLASLFQ